MSSTASTTVLRTISTSKILPKMEEKRLVRTSSLEKFKRFNSFICSQQYFILPGLLAWLRSSQSVLQSSTERTIFFFRAVFFSHLLYKLCQVEFKALLANSAVWVHKQVQTRRVVRWGAYGAAGALFVQLAVCFYLLWGTCVPGGLIFLVGCMFYIVFLNCKCLKLMKGGRRGARRRKME